MWSVSSWEPPALCSYLPVGRLGVGQGLAGQPEVALLEGEAGQELRALCLVFVQVPLLHGDRGQELGPQGPLGHWGGDGEGRGRGGMVKPTVSWVHFILDVLVKRSQLRAWQCAPVWGCVVEDGPVRPHTLVHIE